MRLIPLVVLVLGIGPSSSWAQFNVRARGRFVVTLDDKTVGVPRAVVKLMDSDSDYDVEMASGMTDDKGNFDLRGSSGDSFCADGSDCKRPDPYVRLFFIREGSVDITDEIGFTHSCRTPVREEKAGDVPFGTLSCSDPAPSRLFVRTQRHIRLFREQIGERPPGPATINVMYPSPFTYCFYRTVHVPTGSKTVFHELGHRVRHTLDGDVVHWNNDNTLYRYARSHNPSDVTNEGFAFNEGWATFHAFMHKADPDSVPTTWSGEKQPNVEGFVAHELLRKSRMVCDGRPVGFRGVYLTLKRAGEGKIHTIMEFNEEFLRRFRNCRLAEPPTAPPGPPSGSEDADSLPQYLDSIEQRAAIPVRIGGMRQAMLARTRRLAALREEGSSRFRQDALAAYRRAVTQAAGPAEDSLRDGSQAKREQEARDAYVTSLQPRLEHLRAMKEEVARERTAAHGRGALSYFRSLEAQIARQEAELRQALAARGKPDVRLSPSLAPDWLADIAQENR
jgi:hypothetical protein